MTGYVRSSTENPLGFRPWNFSMSNNGLSFYAPANFIIPAPSGLHSYVPDPTAAAMAAGQPQPGILDSVSPLVLLLGVGAAAWWAMKKKGQAGIFSIGKV